MGVAETPLERVLRLAAVPVRSYTRVGRSGKVQSVRPSTQDREAGQHQAGGAHLKFGTPYRATWNKVSIGDVLEFGQDLWKVIPAAQSPGYKPPDTRHGAGTGTGVGQTTTTTVGVGTAAAKTTPGSDTSSPSSTGTAKIQVYQHFLVNMRSGEFEKARLPANFVVTVIPVLP